MHLFIFSFFQKKKTCLTRLAEHFCVGFVFTRLRTAARDVYKPWKSQLLLLFSLLVLWLRVPAAVHTSLSLHIYIYTICIGIVEVPLLCAVTRGEFRETVGKNDP